MPAKLLQLCLTLYNPLDYSLPGSSVHGFSRQEYGSGLPCPLPGDLLNPGIEPVSPVFPTLAGEFLTTEPLGRLYTGCYIFQETLQSVLDLSLSDVNLEGPGM